ncbi:hypothetical protein KUH03_34360 [Sphingobacterium sp. E70]|uniref:hypothetical protein n=1 Tax=Sphingobacterium sp. E70 TaxID=2853439 RepID=UPI00211BF9BE|nr:hypothetical protein [Sphingobacterium sp. E70]ULT24105.1 hypothetical protein KUH03_34360 [Sphingobacterium sp. E70]
MAAALLGYYAWQIEPHWVKFEQLKLPIKNSLATLKENARSDFGHPHRRLCQ